MSKLKKEREECHAAKDAFFACVDRSKSDEEALTQCKQLRQEFERKCPPSWAHHFVIQKQISRTTPPSELAT
jgi:hypothetical protein